SNEGRIHVKATLPEEARDGEKRSVGWAAHGASDAQVELTNKKDIEVELESHPNALISKLAGVEMEGSELVFNNSGQVIVGAKIHSFGLAALASGVLLDGSWGSRSIVVDNSGDILVRFANRLRSSRGEVAALR